MQSLREKVAVVTGAASGIGLAFCERFAAEGMKLVMADVNELGWSYGGPFTPNRFSLNESVPLSANSVAKRVVWAGGDR